MVTKRFESYFNDTKLLRFRQRSTFLLKSIVVIWLVVLFGCESASDNPTGRSANPDTQQSEKPKFFAVSYPLEWITQQIVGDFANVECPAALTDTPDRWRPDRATLAAIQTADLVISNGTAAPYANWLQTSSLPSARTIEAASKGLSLSDFISVEDIQIVHSHGPEGEHSHPTMVSRTWLSPNVLGKQAGFIKQQLSKRYPDQTETFARNLATLNEKLLAMSNDFEIADSEPSITCLSASPEMKFLTRFAQIEDNHFNWTSRTTPEQATTDFNKRIRQLKIARQASDSTSLRSPSAILIPTGLKTLAGQLDATLAAQNYHPVFIDLLDRNIETQDLLSRLRSNLAAISELRKQTIPRPPE